VERILSGRFSLLSSLCSAQVGFRHAPLRFPLRSHALHANRVISIIVLIGSQLTKQDDVGNCSFLWTVITYAHVFSTDVKSFWSQSLQIAICGRIRSNDDEFVIIISESHTPDSCDGMFVLPCYMIMSVRRLVSGAIEDGVLTLQHEHILRCLGQPAFRSCTAINSHLLESKVVTVNRRYSHMTTVHKLAHTMSKTETNTSNTISGDGACRTVVSNR